MPGYTNQNDWQTTLETLDKQIVELQAVQWRVLEYESDAKDAPRSDLKAARGATEQLRIVAGRLRDAKADLLALERERETYWTGPAARLFGKTVHALRVYLTDLATTFDQYAVVTERVGAAHTAAHSGLYLADQDVDKDWRDTKKTHGSPVTRAAQIADNGRGTTLSTSNSQAYGLARNNFKEWKFKEGVIVRAGQRYATVFNILSNIYLQGRSGYVPLPSPDFSQVVVKGPSTPDDDPADEKPPPGGTDFDPSDIGGGGGPDLSNLGSLGDGGLGGGGLGGGLGGGGLGGGGDAPIPGFSVGSMVPGAGGGKGFDVTGNGRADLSPSGARLPGSDLPAGARTVRRPDGSYGIDLNGDGKADVDLTGKALPGGDAPAGARLVTGPDGTTGYDITGNDVPDLGLDRQPLSNGDLPPGSHLVVSDGGVTGIDLDGDGVPDVTLDGRGLPGAGAGNGGQLVTGPDGRTGFDMDRDGVPEIGLDGKPMRVAPPTPDPGGIVPGDQVRRTTDGTGSTGSGGGQLIAQAPIGGMGYPPPIPPPMGGMGGQQNNDRERQTWLQEEDEVWADDLAPVSALGRPDDDEDQADEPVDEWAAPARSTRGVPRPTRPGPGGTWSPDWARR